MSAETVAEDRTEEGGRLRVELGARGYDILVGENLIAEAGRHVRPLLARPDPVVVTDETVAAIHLEPLLVSLRAAGLEPRSLVVPAGEASKGFATLESLCRKVLASGIERRSALIALGGGVIGDLAGFAAAILLRGLDYVQVPTTLLAQVDSSVGGKTGINTPEGKNLIGAFHQPRLVLADTSALRTLPSRELAAGYSEVVKYGLIDRPGFFEWLEGSGRAVLAVEPEPARRAILESCRAKAEIVAADEREAGRRALLNLGHTFAHALEAECGYDGNLLHGEAVAIGMVLAFDLSARLGLSDPSETARVRRHLEAAGLPVAPPTRIGGVDAVPRLIAHMGRDKKVADGRLAFVLVRGIGGAFVSREVDIDTVRETLAAALQP